MGYWIEGRVEGTIRIDFTAEFVVKGFHNHTHGDEIFLDYLQDSDDLHEVVDCPHEWTTNDWTVREVRLLREDEHTPGEWEEDGHGADYKVVIEFEGVAFPFVLEEWNAKLSCADMEVATAVTGQCRKIVAELPAAVRSVARMEVDGEFTGTGEDGEEFSGVRLNGEVDDVYFAL